MNRVLKGFIAGLALTGALMIPACKHKPPKPPTTVPS